MSDEVERGREIVASGKYEPRDDEGSDEPLTDSNRPIYPSPAAPYRVAVKLYGVYTKGGLLPLRAWRGGWMRWDTTHWIEINNAELREYVYNVLDQVDFEHETKDGIEVKHWNPSKVKVANVLEAMAAFGASVD